MASIERDCFEYALRIAYLQASIERRSRKPNVRDVDQAGPAPPPSSSRRSYDGPSSFFAFDLGSIVGRDSSKSPKYPEKMLKVMDGTLQRIAMGQEPKYADQRFRRTVAFFWSSTWPEKYFQRQIRESRKVEDLILAFVTSSTKALKKEDELADGGWKYELNAQVTLFLDILSDSISAVGPASAELAVRLESYRSRLRDADPPGQEKRSDRSHGDKGDSDSIRSAQKEPLDWSDEVMIKTVRRLFGLSEEDFGQRLKAVQAVCTEQAALDDMKSCLKLLNTDAPHPYGPKDFADNADWISWRTNEVSNLSQIMLLMMQSNPSLSQSSDRSSVSDVSSRIESIALDPSQRHFTYIPSNAQRTYCEILDRCLDDDLEVLKTLPEDEDVSLGILSQEHLTLLGECAMRWRLPSSFRSWVFFSAIIDRFEKGDVPSACVHEAMMMVHKVEMEYPVSQWAIRDVSTRTQECKLINQREGLEQNIVRRNVGFLSVVRSSLEDPRGYHSEEFLEAVHDWQALGVENSRHPTIERISDDIATQIKTRAYHSYISEATDRLEHEGSKTCTFAMRVAVWIEKEAKRLDRKFGEPLTSTLDVVPLVLQQHLTLWFHDLDDSVAALSPSEQNDRMDEVFTLYRKALKLSDMGDAFLKATKAQARFPLAPLFEPTVWSWLTQTSSKTKQWADQALAVDKFEPSSPHGPSSSVTDLFDSFRSAVQFLMDLKWPDEHQLALFATRLSKIISLSISDYCEKMEQLFAEDMRQVETSQTVAQQKAWVEKARATLASLQGERKIQAFFNFTPQSCVKLNNIEAARQQLDQLYDMLRADDLSAYETTIGQDQSEQQQQQQQQTYLFTVKIVLAEGLNLDGSNKLPDSFVILSDEHGTRYAKTRTIYDDADPRWDESFDIPVKGNAWFMATIRHRNLSGKHDLLGRAYLRLDPAQHLDLMTRDVLLPLDSRGHILLRVSMEGERDDIQFHFGRAFRWLKRTESDMVRTLVDKSVLKPIGNNSLDYNEAIGKISAAYRSAMGTPEYTIPPTKEERRRGPTDAEIEAAIHPLFDYLDTNNHTLASTLSHDAMQMVMTKLWKQILMTIEGLIVPPLSDKPSHMRALSDGELDIALKWLKFLRDFFYVGGDASGVPLNILQNQKFNEILSVRIYYDWRTDDLMEECIRGFQSTLRHRATKPSKSLVSQRNLGTIRARKSAKRALPSSGGNTEMIMRILRMRHGTQEFLAQQIQTISMVKMENPKKGKSLRSRLSR
ncbi:hypothetical protein CI109_106518 [Kwoniella shandongensis]|uniref:C2 domain-containing protein n=1 Tax=Kwoniella shandongensis TaxID=1734106 RepID=A0AAJ8MZS9_9TREE